MLDNVMMPSSVALCTANKTQLVLRGTLAPSITPPPSPSSWTALPLPLSLPSTLSLDDAVKRALGTVASQSSHQQTAIKSKLDTIKTKVVLDI